MKTVVKSERRKLVYPASRTEYRTDNLLAEYNEYLSSDQGPGSGPYVEIDGTMYAYRTTEIHREHIPIDVSAASGGSDAFELTIAPSHAGTKPAFEGPVEVASAWSIPGPLWIHAVGNRHQLDHVETVVKTSSDEGPRPVESRESVSLTGDSELLATYRMPDKLPPHTFRAWVGTRFVGGRRVKPTRYHTSIN